MPFPSLHPICFNILTPIESLKLGLIINVIEITYLTGRTVRSRWATNSLKSSLGTEEVEGPARSQAKSVEFCCETDALLLTLSIKSFRTRIFVAANPNSPRSCKVPIKHFQWLQIYLIIHKVFCCKLHPF